jgi:DNA-binding CsgD family transcriptional regulator/predicted ester cyclase
MDLLDELTNNVVIPIWNNKELGVIDQYFAQEADIRTTFLSGKGPLALKESVRQTFLAFPVFELKIEEIIQQDNRVTYKWNALCEHKGPILNIQATGKKLEFHGIVYAEINLERKLITQYHSFSNIPQTLYANIEPAVKEPFPIHVVLLEHENYEKEISDLLFSITKRTGVRLTRREVECLNFWLRGYSIKETARQLGGLSAKTIQVFRDNLRKKFNVSTYHALFDLMRKSGTLDLFLGNYSETK